MPFSADTDSEPPWRNRTSQIIKLRTHAAEPLPNCGLPRPLAGLRDSMRSTGGNVCYQLLGRYSVALE